MAEEEREILDLDVLFVGAGPASLAGAYRLGKQIQEYNEKADEPLEIMAAVLEKGKEIGSHALSGAVIDPKALQELFPDTWQDAPFEGKVENEKFLLLTPKKAISLPIPPPLVNKGKYVASLGKLCKWMADQVEELEIDIFCEFPATEALVEKGEDGKERVTGVRTGDRGINKEGEKKSNYEPGVDIVCPVTILGEGPRGTVTKQLDERFALSEGKNPMTYAIGIKEIWEVPEGRMQAGDVIHTMGWPLDTNTFGGGFIYGMADNQIIVGLVVGLDYQNPLLDPHTEFQRMKTNPWLRDLLQGGKMTYYGAKAIPEGGWWAMPRPWGDGFLLTGDSAGFLNSQRLKGVHLAMKSGMMAADTVFDALKQGGVTAERLAGYEDRIAQSWAKEELWKVRNFHQAFDKGLFAGMLQTGLGMVSGGRGWGLFDKLETEAGHKHMRKLSSGAKAPEPVAYDGELTFDKLANVYNSGAAHEEDQPVHLKVADTEHCVTQCLVEYDAPCQRFCPANVYEIVDDTSHDTGKRLQINASNCVHCKTCDIMDPYQIITWVPPEGGGGPNYGRM